MVVALIIIIRNLIKSKLTVGIILFFYNFNRVSKIIYHDLFQNCSWFILRHNSLKIKEE